MAELAVADELSDEQRSELDAIERGTPDLERQLRAATIAVETETADAETRTADDPDAEQRERVELRSRAQLTNFLRAALSGQQIDGAEAELRSAAGVTGIPLELWDVPQPIEQRVATEAPATPGVNLDRIRPAVFANSIAPRLGIEMPRVESGTYASATIETSLTAAALICCWESYGNHEKSRFGPSTASVGDSRAGSSIAPAGRPGAWRQIRIMGNRTDDANEPDSCTAK